MSTHWITIAKVAGPLVNLIRGEMLNWTAAGPGDGEEPKSVNGDVFLVKEKHSVRRMHELAGLLETNATLPPIVYYERLIDPWTVCPLLVIYTEFRERQANLRLARSDGLDYLLIQPSFWPNFKEELLRIQTRRCTGNAQNREHELLIAHIINCAVAWESLLSAHGIHQAIVMTSQGVAPSWLDSEVVAMSEKIPPWYEGEGDGT